MESEGFDWWNKVKNDLKKKKLQHDKEKRLARQGAVAAGA